MAKDANDFFKGGSEPFRAFFDMQGEAMREMMGQLAQGKFGTKFTGAALDPGDMAEFANVAREIQAMWFKFMAQRSQGNEANTNPFDPAQWLTLAQGMAKQIPTDPIDTAQRLAKDSMEIWQGVLGGFLGGGSKIEAPDADALPRKDRRFAAEEWRAHPAFALLHQTYLMMAEYFVGAAKQVEGIAPEKRKQLEFATTALVDAMSPDNFILTNPVVLKRTIETKGQNLLKGMQHLINDLKKGQLTHTDAEAFELGVNLAATPGKVVHETPLYQLVQYTPSTDEVFATPLIIFPPWINRFYILDLTAKKSFIKWAVDQGISVFVVSWKSADASMKDVIWDDYIRAQIDAIDTVRERLKVPSVHAIGYCVAGTTLAATLAILAKRNEADKVKSATFFTAQVDFEKAGELKHFIDDGQLEMISNLSSEGYLDGRYLAATFNSLRGKDLIWNYVVNNYLLGEDYPAFDLLHWNGDVTNLPSKWHADYLRDLYRDNKLVVPGALSADGTAIDLSQVNTPAFIQAGREDHIAPAESVWKATEHFKGPVTFLLAGSGHIAGVVNPPSANKYQYWTGESTAASLKDFVDGATEHPGSWWPHWLEWLEQQDSEKVPAKGKRKPGGKGDKVIEDAPGRYVKTR
ncbi:class I poly(R)-hydroxyalkanoic acid synthase [Altererythrobacter sp.]|uniref:PHA/PHB synthase family protein n=1 Tax=Altererythrobacter sp. TaxID=1872480 RepID=UPI001B18FDAD|nr:class I poly(R)-hydroxyalkanoic acid synthase [Altererythrobacter sp.]MBO6610163.1 class I poly(R)-hydroxyalkanoic acid synthase [Altererythrobacter sp.]MBO6642766.1 class I poly(R)-hydroxyalkanoic acid synthase [Altererythrobacter sp.]MBO6708726.1 class I poly(R)-hydroxyalkanoic acid synthase [Altererythrobacter sp.]